MSSDFTGGGFEELARETEKLKADAARLRSVTERSVQNITQDETARKALAQRARQATSRSIAEAETIISQGARAGGVTAEAQTAAAASATRQMDSLAASSERALVPLRQMRSWGTYPFANSARGAEQLAAQMQRIGLTGRAAAPANAAQSNTALSTLNRQAGFVAPIGEKPGSYTAITAAATAETAAVERDATAHAVLNAQMARHGALSSEFIQQLARGNVSLREFGSQLTVTAGKFGGWLAAGAGIFTLLGTLGAVGKGAIDAASGVNQLERVVNNVDPTSAQAGFRQLSEQFNLPIATVTDAAYQMGKVFHDQNDALLATQSVLYAVKVGELSTADAARYLTAITNGFNLTAAETPGLFDQINQAQNRYNISTSSVLAGTAKAAGAFKLAGGDATHLIALITTLSKVSGQTGDVIGTAIARSPHFINIPQNQQILKGFGIDASQSIIDIYNEAIKKAQTLAPAKQRQLSEALFGSLRGSQVGVQLFQHGDLLKQVLRDVSPEASAGSAQRELQTTLGSITERLQNIPIQLAALGSNLASSGFLDLLGVAVGLLDRMLKIINGLFEAFNLLPAPLRHSVLLMAELYGIFRLLRRFNIGSTLPGAAGQLLTNPRNALNDQRQVAAVKQSDLSGQLISASSATTAAETERAVQQARLVQAQKIEQRLTVAGVADTKLMAAAAQEQVSARAGVSAADRAILAARERESVIARRLAAVTEEQAALRRAPVSSRQTGVYGIPFTDSGATPPGSRFRPTTGSLGVPFQRSASLLQANMQEFGVVGGVVGTAVDGVRSAATSVRTSTSRINFGAAKARVLSAASSFKSLGSGILGMISPLDLAFANLILFATALSSAQAKRADLDKINQTLGNPSSAADVQSSLDQITSSYQGEHLLDDLTNRLSGVQDARNAAIGAFEDQTAGIENFKVAIERIGRGDKLDPSERQAYNAGTFQDVYEAAATDIRTRLARHVINLQTANKMLDALIQSAKTSPLVKDPTTLIQQLRQTATGDQAQVDATTLQKRADLAAASAPLYQDAGNAQNALATALQVLSTLKKEGASASDILDARVKVAQAKRELQSQVNDEIKGLTDAVGAVRLSEINPDATVARARQTAATARQSLDLLRAQKRSPQDIKNQVAAVNDAEAAVQTAIRERMIAMVEIATRLTTATAAPYSTTAGPEAELAAAREKLQILRTHGATGKEIRDAQATIAESERALLLAQNDQAKSISDAAGQIAIARIDPNNTVGIARQTAENARNAYQLAVSQGRDQGTVMSAYATMLQAESAFNQAVKQQAEDIQHARFAILTARAQAQGNDVRAAAIAARQALYDIAHADTREERLTGQAALISARASRRDAIYQTELSDIQFQADIGRITLQQQINQYEQMLHTLKLTRDQRRELRQKIYDLQHQDDGSTDGLDLALGNIKLPTIYEIRRAIKGHGLDSRSPVVNQTNNVKIDVKNGKDAEKVGQKLDKTINGGAHNAMRSAGLI